MEIIIVKYKNPEAEERCIESVKKYTDLARNNLRVFDNAEENINLGELWNRLVERSNDNNICLLNSDTIVEEGWIKLEESLRDEKIGAVGPITNHAGTVQRSLTRDDKIIEAQGNQLSGFCYLFRKDVWKEVGGFPEDFPFYGQESAFNVKLVDRGYKLMIDQRVYIEHDRQSSSFNKAKERGEITNDEATWGAFHFWNYCDRLKILREVVDQDFRIAVVGGGEGNPFPLFKGTEQAVKEMFGSNGLVLSAADDNVQAINKFKPSMYLCLQTGWHDRLAEGITAARDVGAKSVLYFNDLRCPGHSEWYTPYTHSLEDYFDVAFIGNTAFIKEWKEITKVPEVYYLPQASIQHPRPPKGEPREHLHIGGFHHLFHQNRKEVFEELDDLNIAHLNAKGDGNNELREDRIRIQEASYGDYGSADFSWGISPDVPMYTSDRLYNIICAGGCAIHFKPEGMGDVFKHKEHCYWFRTPEEAREIIEKSTPQEREEIKKRAFIHGQKHHTYKMRLLNILTNVYTDDKSYHGYLKNLWNIGK